MILKSQQNRIDLVTRPDTDQVGHLWCSLADYYIRAGLFERARDIYEESIQTVMTVRDFTQVREDMEFISPRKHFETECLF